MPYRLSLLDKSPSDEYVSPVETLRNTVTLAVRAEQLGYHRYWLAEHHNVPNLISPAPEVLAAWLLARTQRIRIGSGGVMLRHYAPYKVAEVFNLLATLAPGRVDLGIGKAPGGLPLSTRALQGGRDGGTPRDFDQALTELDAFLTDTLADDHPLAGLKASPQPPVQPERFLLGASIESAELAAKLDWQFCYAGHFDGDPERLGATFDIYRRTTGRAPLLAVVALAADTPQAAQDLVGGLRTFKVRLDSGLTVNVGSLEGAAEFARQAGASSYETTEARPSILSGTAADVRAQLDDLHHRFGIQEFVIDAPIADFSARLRSLELLIDVQRAAA